LSRAKSVKPPGWTRVAGEVSGLGAIETYFFSINRLASEATQIAP
jgi:hypothetical protein